MQTKNIYLLYLNSWLLYGRFCIFRSRGAVEPTRMDSIYLHHHGIHSPVVIYRLSRFYWKMFLHYIYFCSVGVAQGTAVFGGRQDEVGPAAHRQQAVAELLHQCCSQLHRLCISSPPAALVASRSELVMLPSWRDGLEAENIWGFSSAQFSEWRLTGNRSKSQTSWV